MVEEGFVQLYRCRGPWEFRKTRGRAAYRELLRCPDRLRGCRGQEGGPVIPLGLLNGFEVGRPSSPCRGKEGGVESVYLGGAEGGVVGPPELR